MDLGGVLVVVLIIELWEGVDEGNKRESIMRVDEGNQMVMSSTWLYLMMKAS
jgi:hypothetical protein